MSIAKALRIEGCVWKFYWESNLGKKRQEIESQYGCHKCTGTELDCHGYVPQRAYMKEISSKILDKAISRKILEQQVALC